ncbi:MAG: hypothetical protein IJL30_01675 [Clostridia bacterium]|nr:hypothetical protein [Clostridia bacterium]
MKRLLVLLSFIFLICLTCSCSTDTKPSEIENLLSDKKVSETNSNTPDVIHDDNVFVSVWPDELPETNFNGEITRRGRPVQFNYEIEPGYWTSEWLYSSMYLYDFPDPAQFFHRFGYSAVLDINAIHFYYNNVIEEDGSLPVHIDITKEEFASYIEKVKEAGYTDNSRQTETSYYCEKYGVGITIVLAKDFPWVDEDPRLEFFGDSDSIYIQLQLIDPDYVMDLEQIKAEEYQKWLEKQ